jgi:hypothetical protein
MADNVVQVIIRAKDEASDELKRFQGTIGQVGTAITGLSALVTGASVALWKIGESAAKRGEDLLAMSQKANVSVEEISRLQYAAQLSETSIESLAVGLRFLQKNAVENADAFAKYGIAVKDASGQLLSTDAILRKSADAFSHMAEGPAKGAAAIELFGRAGTQLLPLLNEGSAGIAKLESEADRLGITVSTASAALGDEFSDSMVRVKMQIEGLKMALAEQLLPVMIEVTGKASEAMVKFQEWAKVNGPLISAITQVTASLAPLAFAVTGLVAVIGTLRLAMLALGISMGGPVAIAIAAVGAVLAAFAVKAVEAREKLKEPFKIDFQVVTEGVDAVEAKLLNAKNRLSGIQDQLDELKRSPGLAFTSGNADELKIQLAAAKTEVSGYEKMLATMKATQGAAATATRATNAALSEQAQAAAKAAAEWKKLQETLVLSVELELTQLKFKPLTIKVQPEILPVSGELPENAKLEMPVSGMDEWAEAVGLTNEQIGDMIVQLGTANELVVGVTAGFEAFAERGAAVFNLMAGVADAVFQGMMDTVNDLGDSFADALVDGQNVLISIGKTVEKIVKQIISDLIAAIAKALILKVITSAAGGPLGFLFSQGGTVKLSMGGEVRGPTATPPFRQAVPTVFSPIIKLATGGSVQAPTPKQVFAPIFSPIIKLASGGSVQAPTPKQFFSAVFSPVIKLAVGGSVAKSGTAVRPADVLTTIASPIIRLATGGSVSRTTNVYRPQGTSTTIASPVIKLSAGGSVLKSTNVMRRADVFTTVAAPIIKLATGGTVSERSTASTTREILRTVSAPFVKLAMGGSVPRTGGAVLATSVARGASGFTVPGAIQVLDRVPALLSPGEVVLPTVAGQTPASILGDLAAFARQIKQEAARPTRGMGTTNNVNIQAFNLDMLRDMLRHGDLRREELRAFDLGRA